MKLLLIGYGSIGARHFYILSKCYPNLEIDVVSRSHSDAKYQKLDDLNPKQLNNYDIFMICSETLLHCEQLKFIDRFVSNKIILVEKPLFTKADDYQPTNHVLVCYNLRFHPVITKLKQILSKENILSFRVNAGQYLPSWRSNQHYKDSYSSDIKKGGGVLRDLSHEIDYTSYICGKLSLISAFASSGSHLNLSSDDQCSILATNEKGTHIQIHIDYLSYKSNRRIEIQTDYLTITSCLIDNYIEIYDRDGFVEKIKFKEMERNYTYRQLHDSVMKNNTQVMTSFQEAMSTMQLIDDITENHMEKKWLTKS